jgi:hypothetical protein
MMKAECPGASLSKKFQHIARFGGKILRAESTQTANAFLQRSLFVRYRIEIARNTIVPILLYITMWSCALGLAASMGAILPPPIEAEPALAASMSE